MLGPRTICKDRIRSQDGAQTPIYKVARLIMGIIGVIMWVIGVINPLGFRVWGLGFRGLGFRAPKIPEQPWSKDLPWKVTMPWVRYGDLSS